MSNGSLEVLANIGEDTNLPLNYVERFGSAPNGDIYFTSSTERVLFNAKKRILRPRSADSYRFPNLCKGDNGGEAAEILRHLSVNDHTPFRTVVRERRRVKCRFQGCAGRRDEFESN